MKATVFEAKTNFSALLRKAQQGEEVVITSGREKKPVARLVPVEPFAPRRLDVRGTPGFEITDAFWEPLPPGWDGEREAE